MNIKKFKEMVDVISKELNFEKVDNFYISSNDLFSFSLSFYYEKRFLGFFAYPLIFLFSEGEDFYSIKNPYNLSTILSMLDFKEGAYMSIYDSCEKNDDEWFGIYHKAILHIKEKFEIHPETSIQRIIEMDPNPIRKSKISSIIGE